jgi:phosphatidylethanolamine-binding protein (PEBP) family uncharacterized protein
LKLLLIVLFLAIWLGIQGCGGGDSEIQVNHVGSNGFSFNDGLMVRSSALESDYSLEKIPLRYECSEDFLWFPLEWGQVPNGTDEIAVTITASTLKRKGEAVSSELVTTWIIGGLSASTRAIYPGPLPAGSFITGHNVNFGNCPSRSRETGFVFTVNALPKGRHLKSFEAIGLATVEALEESALARGSVLATYGNG